MKGTFIVLQARMKSTRLPGKLLLPLKGITMLEHILMRLRYAEVPQGVIVATTEDTLPHIKNIIKKFGALPFAGSEEDVLGRFYGAVRLYDVKTAVRATADNPFVCIQHLDMACRLHEEMKGDLTTFSFLHYGTGIEVIRGEIIELLNREVTDPFEREHITQHIYRNESRFKVVRGMPERYYRRPELRLTVDTQEDYERVSAIYEALYRGFPISLSEVIEYLDSRS